MNERKFIGGFNFRGIEEPFESMIHKAINERTTRDFRYLEIGIAHGRTLISVAELLRETSPHDWQCVGIDLLDGPYFNTREFLKATLAFDTHIEFEGKCTREPYVADRITSQIRILLLKGSEKRAQIGKGCVNFCLIDGCHGAPCVEKDFLAVEGGIAKGGIVAFHDAGIEDQGHGFQPHCQQNIGVKRALNDLGLWSISTLDPSPPMRPEWQYVGGFPGDKSPGNPCDNGNGIVFFQKV